jgi:hypothetical protein
MEWKLNCYYRLCGSPTTVAVKSMASPSHISLQSKSETPRRLHGEESMNMVLIHEESQHSDSSTSSRSDEEDGAVAAVGYA